MTFAIGPVDAEALFGSAARQDGDRFSDLDYLIVDRDPAKLRGRKRWLKAQGFSVSDYTWSRLERCFAEQTLFALHLRLEARLISDRTGRLSELFHSSRAKSSYRRDYLDSLELFQPLERVPGCSLGRAWALDTLAVAFRNSAILWLAEEGEHIFSMNSILNELKARGRIDDEQSVTLRSLRMAKSLYRSGRSDHASQAWLDGALCAVSCALGIDISSHVALGLDRIRNPQRSVSAYAWMRSIEAELISAPARVAADPEANAIRSRLLQDVTDPHSYLWRFVRERGAVEAELDRLRSFY